MDTIFNTSKLNKICEQNGITYLGLFGSQSRHEQTDLSDIDLLVKFNKPTGYFKMVKVQKMLKDMLNKDVDLVTDKALSKYIRPYVYKDLKTLYGTR